MKKVKIEYEYLNSSQAELMVMSISTDFPKFEEKRLLYIYEISEMEGLGKRLEDFFNSEEHLSSKDYLAPIIVSLTNKEYEELDDYLMMDDEECIGKRVRRDTVYESIVFSEDYARLNMAIDICRKDIKFWEC